MAGKLPDWELSEVFAVSVAAGKIVSGEETIRFSGIAKGL